MATVAQTARVITGEPDDLTDGIQRNAWLLWRSVTTECMRKEAKQTADGYWVYVGTLRWHTVHLWPTMEDDERRRFERELYAFLAHAGLARNIKRREPTIWHVAVTWQTPNTRVVPTTVFRMSHAERRVTPEEAGETLPPSEVTVRTTKETDMTRAKKKKEAAPAPEPVAAVEAVAAETPSGKRDFAGERAVRRELICQLLAETDQPLVAEEIGYSLSLDVSAVRKELIELEKSGAIFSRNETNEERETRYGAVARAQRAFLWSDKDPVPERTEREAVTGFVREPSSIIPLGRNEVARRLAQFFKDKSLKYTFTSAQVAEKSGVPAGTVRSRVSKWCEAGIVERIDTSKLNHRYRIIDKPAMFKELREEHLLVKKEEPVAVDPTPVPVAPPVPAPPAAGFDLLSRAGEILDENVRLREALTETRTALEEARAGCQRLQRQADTAAVLKAENDQLRAELEELKNRPAVDAETARRLAEWQPVPSV